MKDNFQIRNNEAHIWSFNIIPPDNILEQYFDSLSDAEKIQVNKIRIDSVRRGKISSKFITKRILAWYLREEIDNINFSYNEFGKPEILHSINPLSLQFNISHSGDLGMIAITKGNSVGIDVEKIIDVTNVDEIINLCFSDYEINLLLELDQHSRMNMFYKIWTCKEAFVKTLGKGFSFPLKNISFKLNTDGNIMIDDNHLKRDTYSNWQVYNFSPGKNYTSTLVINNKFIETKHFAWNSVENVVEVSS